MRLPPMTTRRWMVAVATLATLLTAGITGQRWVVLQERARHFANQAWANSLEAGNSFELAYDDVRSGNGEKSALGFARDAYFWRRRALHFDSLRRKYEGAMWRPWLPVAPDPPEPE